MRAAWGRWRISSKIGALLLVSVTAPLVVAQAITYARAREVARERTEALLATRAEQLVSELDALNRLYLAGARRAAQLGAASRALTRGSDAERRELVSQLEAFPSSDDAILAAHVVDARGRIEASSNPTFDGLDISFRGFIRQALQGMTVISDPFLALPVAREVPVVAYAAPVFRPGGQVIGAAVVLVRAHPLWQAVRSGNERGGPGSYSVLVDASGIRLAHSTRDEFVFHAVAPLSPAAVDELSREQRFGQRTREILDAPIPTPELMRVALAPERPPSAPFLIDSPANGQMNVVVARRLWTTGWTLFYVVPVATIEAPARRVAAAFFPAALVGLLAIVVSVGAARRALRPAGELAGAVDAVARGESPRVPVSGSDELAHLATRFNEMAAAVQNAKADLETRVQQRTQDLSRANQELEAQKRELVAQREELERQRLELQEKNGEVERADRLKSQFLANMSHEVRTPLNSILGFSELLADQAGEKLTPAEARYLHDVQASGKHLLQLINDILDLSKIEAGQMVLECAPVTPATAVAEVTALLLPAARDKKIDVRVKTDSSPPVRADARRLRQILLNLLSNAIKFAPEGSPVEIEARQQDDHVRFVVRDRGPGLSESFRSRLFQPFAQAEGPLARGHEGTGLGLAICRRLVELHGGAIGVESTPGQGAAFHFTLPVAAPSLEPEGDGRQVVFLVDETSGSTRELEEWLGGEGYRVVAVERGADAWELAARTRPAAIVLDPSVEHRDGFQLLDELRRRKATRAIPVVVSSSPSAADFIAKPPEREQILGAVADGVRPAAATPPATVLSIDDDPNVGTILRAVLEPQGSRVLSAGTGATGLDAARSARPSIVIVDLLLPDMTGFAVVDALAADEATRNIPVIVLTGADLLEADRRRLESYVRGVMEKGSVTREQLVASVQRALARRSRPVAGMSVVVIDDNDLNRELARALLERRGWRVVLADSGELGIARVRAERPALVICDLAMPGMDGLTVARQLKSHAETAEIPLVAMTALAMRGDEERALAAGFDGYLAKPIDRKALDAAIAAVLERTRRDRR